MAIRPAIPVGCGEGLINIRDRHDRPPPTAFYPQYLHIYTRTVDREIPTIHSTNKYTSANNTGDATPLVHKKALLVLSALREIVNFISDSTYVNYFAVIVIK